MRRTNVPAYRSYPLWVRSVGVLVPILSFPCVAIAACFGAGVTWTAWLGAAVVSRYALSILAGRHDRNDTRLTLLSTTALRLQDVDRPWQGMQDRSPRNSGTASIDNDSSVRRVTQQRGT